MFNKKYLISCLAAVAAVAAPAQSFAQDRTKVVLDVNFAQSYTFGACPAQWPATHSCLTVTGTANLRSGTALSFNRVAAVNTHLFDYQHPTCIPIETKGVLTLPRGALNVHGMGNVCFTEGVAFYNLIVTGGTGAYVGAMGSAQVTVPPPLTDNTGRELWHLELVGGDSNAYRID